MTEPLDLSAARARLGSARGKTYWRSLEELANTPGFEEMLHREFPRHASEWTDPVTRRQFLTLAGASLALAGLGGCAQKVPEKIMPYTRQPEDLVPGKPLFYATAMALGRFATGLLVESHEGRPIKVEGNPEHPVSKGATDVHAQASVLTMYDPDRSQTASYLGRPRAWTELVPVLRTRLYGTSGKPVNDGEGVYVLTEAVASPTLARQLDAFRKRFPKAKVYSYEPTGPDNALNGAKLAFGKPVHTYYRLDRADVVVALDADFFTCGPASLMYARGWADRRRQAIDAVEKKGHGEGAAAGEGNAPKMSRLYVVESNLTSTGGAADNRLRIKASQVEGFARALGAAVGVADVKAPTLEGLAATWVTEVAADLKAQAKGRTLVIPGDGQPPAVHALTHAINGALGNLGETVVVVPDVPAEYQAVGSDSIKEFAADLGQNKVKTLFFLGGNPVYNAPGDLKLPDLLEKNGRREGVLHVRLGLYDDETSRLSHWHVPEAHFLEAWGDARAVDGTASVVQPLIAPLYGGRSPLELLSSVLDDQPRPPYELVRETWRAWWEDPKGGAKTGGDFEKFWQRAVHDGFIRGTDWKPGSASVAGDLAGKLPPAPDAAKPGEFELQLLPDPVLHDGRFANNGWLQELPKPITRLTWDNVLIVSPKTAEKLGVNDRNVTSKGGEHGIVNADMVKVTLDGGRKLENVPVWIQPGHADDAFTLHLGYGRSRAGRVGTKIGVDANTLRSAGAADVFRGVKVEKTGARYTLACVQNHHTIEGRNIIRADSFDHFKEHPDFAQKVEEHEPAGGHEGQPAHGEAHGEGGAGGHGRRELPTLYPRHEYTGHKWGMAIDLATCVGCSACVVACQAENNIPVIGKTEVTRGREMHWLRIDHYYGPVQEDGKPTRTAEVNNPGEQPYVPPNPSVFYQPLPCMHCEDAPCELVCPVNATVHSAEGTNDMVYNRCVGTRYCSNNCPYKVRRFNYLFYAEENYYTPSLHLLNNPDVSVRTRGVMEKCTYCIQRINFARIEAEKEGIRQREGGQDRIEPEGRSRNDPERPGIAVVFDGEIETACQSVCPTGAIVFGDLNDRGSRVARLHGSERNYGLLAELNTRPRTTYLAAVRNPNPKIPLEKSPAEGGK
jgi:molybdopterin-containing oxidoreductase family iron-sulfur binding subunit